MIYFKNSPTKEDISTESQVDINLAEQSESDSPEHHLTYDNIAVVDLVRSIPKPDRVRWSVRLARLWVASYLLIF